MNLNIELEDDQLDSLADALAPLLAGRVAALVAEMVFESPWMDVSTAARHLACPKSRIYALVSAGRIPHRKDGSRLLFRREELDEWVRGGGAKRP